MLRIKAIVILAGVSVRNRFENWGMEPLYAAQLSDGMY